MDIAYQLATYIEMATGGTLGTDIFVGQIPAETDGTYVVRGGGVMNNYVPIEESVLDVYVKNINASTAISTLEDIKRFLHRLHNTETSSAYIYTFLVLGDVEDVARDMEYAKIFKITVQVTHRDKTLIS